MSNNNTKTLHMVAFTLAMVGALNWGIMGLFNGYNLVNSLLGSWPTVEQVVYILVGASGAYLLFTHKNDCKICSQ